MINENDVLAKIVVFDSGLGSLSVIKEIQKIGKNDIIYFDKSSSHRIEINKEPYHVIRQENVVVVL